MSRQRYCTENGRRNGELCEYLYDPETDTEPLGDVALCLAEVEPKQLGTTAMDVTFRHERCFRNEATK